MIDSFYREVWFSSLFFNFIVYSNTFCNGGVDFNRLYLILQNTLIIGECCIVGMKRETLLALCIPTMQHYPIINALWRIRNIAYRGNLPWTFIGTVLMAEAAAMSNISDLSQGKFQYFCFTILPIHLFTDTNTLFVIQ